MKEIHEAIKEMIERGEIRLEISLDYIRKTDPIQLKMPKVENELFVEKIIEEADGSLRIVLNLKKDITR